MATFASRPAWELRVAVARVRADRRPRSRSALLVGAQPAAAHARAQRRLLDRRGALGRDRRPAAARHPRRPAPGRLAAAVLHAAARLDGARRQRRARRRTRCRCCSRSLPSRSRCGARGLVFGAPRGVDRGGAGRAQPVPDAVRAGDAHVRARGAARHARDGAVRCAPTPATSAPARRWPVAVRRSRSRPCSTRTTGRSSSAWRCGVAWLALLALAPAAERRRAAARRRCSASALTALLYLPWVPTLLFQAAHTGAPWSRSPSSRTSRSRRRTGCSATRRGSCCWSARAAAWSRSCAPGAAGG